MTKNTHIGRPESDETLAALDLMVALKQQGHGWRGIAKRLTLAKVPTTYGGAWRPGTVRAVMLRHRDRWE